jgi:tripartite-type tricarboxylate transporter receptor subunit TctC
MKTPAKLIILFASAILVLPGTTWSQPYPSKPIRIVVSSSPQGGTDTIARIMATALGESMGQQVVVENRPGAGGQIGTSFVARAPADGYTLLMSAAAAVVIHPNTFSKLPYDIARDFTPVSLVASSDYILAVHPSMPVKTVKDLVALARAKPGQIAFSSSGRFGIPHLAGELFKQVANVDMLHVPYKGGGPAAIAILSGEVSLMFGTGPTVVPHARAGKLRLIATASEKRSRMLPELPTIGETLPGIVVTAWYGIQVPSGTPRDVVMRLHGEIVKAVSNERVLKAITSAGLEPVTNTPEEFAEYIRTQTALWGKVVKASGVALD